MRILFLTQTYPRFDGDPAGPFIRELARGLVRIGDEVTVLAPHAEDVAASWDDDGVAVKSFRYAPERLELLGYSRSLQKDETMKAGALLSAPLYARRLARRRSGLRRARERRPSLRRAPGPLGGAQRTGGGALRRPGGAGCRHPRERRLHGGEALGPAAGAQGAAPRWASLTGCSPELVEPGLRPGLSRRALAGDPLRRRRPQFAPTQRRGIWRERLGMPRTRR